ncbi:MAG TPA: hypothetical protein VM470_05370 [Acidimicrobiia bacterium]|nr:hypothetical protein [Acidimicrobiia bacterium]
MPDQPAPEQPLIVAVVLFTPGMQIEETLSALDKQVYKPDSVLVVGGGENERELIAARGYVHVGSVGEVLGKLAESASFVWWLHADTRPRPDALSALVTEAVRNDASVAGSKVLVAGWEDQLHSVGAATDAFGEPYSGLDPGELDLEQYDVVREVAFVSPLSMLIRRDLLRGLGGLDASLPAQAGGLDLSQRARVAGAKVIVVPSSEVFHADACPSDRPGWRQRAGRYRAMLVSYQLITLAWVLPVGLLASLADSAGQITLGRLRPLISDLASWVWVLGRLPSVFKMRRALRRIRETGDEELFRFQVRGSVRLRETGAEMGERLSRALEGGEDDVISERAKVVWKRPSAILALTGVVALLLATRSIWLSGLPQSGFSLLPGEDPVSTLLAYAGGWNASGLGTPNPPPPIAALGALATLLVGGKPELAGSVLTVLALIAGLAGVIRISRRTGVTLAAGYVAGVVYLGGAAATTLFGSGQWPLLLAAGPLPWALDAVMTPVPVDGRRRFGLAARGGVAAALTAAAYPPALGIVVVGGLLLALAMGRPRALGVVGAISVLGALGIAPWVVGGEVMALLGAAPVPAIQPFWFWPATIGLATVAATLSVSKAHLPMVAWGGVAASGGWLLGMIPDLPPGFGLAGLLAASMGAGFLASTLLAAGEHRWSRWLTTVVLIVLVAPAALTIVRGRGGLPSDEWSRRLDFVSAISEGVDPGRVLVFGSPEEIPGQTRAVGSVAYRLIDGDRPTLEQAYLPGVRLGDGALEQAIFNLAAADSIRPGVALGQFGITWLVVLPGTTALNDALIRQVDLSPLLIDSDLRAFENRSLSARAVTDEGETWSWTGRGYEGSPSSGRVVMADNADPDWSPEWAQADWANSVSAAEGRAYFRANPTVQGAAYGSGLVLALMVVLAWWGRGGVTAK